MIFPCHQPPFHSTSTCSPTSQSVAASADGGGGGRRPRGGGPRSSLGSGSRGSRWSRCRQPLEARARVTRTHARAAEERIQRWSHGRRRPREKLRILRAAGRARSGGRGRCTSTARRSRRGRWSRRPRRGTRPTPPERARSDRPPPRGADSALAGGPQGSWTTSAPDVVAPPAAVRHWSLAAERRVTFSPLHVTVHACAGAPLHVHCWTFAPGARLPPATSRQ